MPLKGSCACSAIHYIIPGDDDDDDEPKTFRVCHCSTCKAFTGGIAIHVDAGRNPTIEDPDNNLSIWKSSPGAERGFCKTCGSSLFFKPTAPGPLQGMYYFCAGGLQDWKGLTPGREVYADCRPPGVSFDGPHHFALTKAEYEAIRAKKSDNNQNSAS